MNNNAVLLGFISEYRNTKQADIAPTMVQPKKKPSMLPWLAGGAALLGGGYLADKHLNNSGVMNSVKGFFTDPGENAKLLSNQRAMNRVYYGSKPSESIPNALQNTNLDPSYSPTEVAGLSLGHAGMNAEMGIGGAALANSGVQAASKRLLGNSVSLAPKWLAPAATKIAPTLAPLAMKGGLKALGGVGNAYMGYQIGKDPLVTEGWAEPAKAWYNPAWWAHSAKKALGVQESNMTPNQVSNITGALGGGGGLSTALAGPVGLTTAALGGLGGKVMLDDMSQALTQQAGKSQVMQNSSDLLMDAIREMKYNGPQRPEAIRQVKAWLDHFNNDLPTWQKEYPAAYTLAQRARSMAGG